MNRGQHHLFCLLKPSARRTAAPLYPLRDVATPFAAVLKLKAGVHLSDLAGDVPSLVGQQWFTGTMRRMWY
jgi:hypothetical protein